MKPQWIRHYTAGPDEGGNHDAPLRRDSSWRDSADIRSRRLWRNNALPHRAGLRLTRLPLTDGNLLRLFFTHPLVTLKAVGGIHWQALRLWARGAQFHKRPEPRKPNITSVEKEAIAS